jgi:hypothetical protein
VLGPRPSKADGYGVPHTTPTSAARQKRGCPAQRARNEAVQPSWAPRGVSVGCKRSTQRAGHRARRRCNSLRVAACNNVEGWSRHAAPLGKSSPTAMRERLAQQPQGLWLCGGASPTRTDVTLGGPGEKGLAARGTSHRIGYALATPTSHAHQPLVWHPRPPLARAHASTTAIEGHANTKSQAARWSRSPHSLAAVCPLRLRCTLPAPPSARSPGDKR